MSRGMTLLEVLIALAIFTMIGIATVQQLTQIRNTKESALEDLDSYSAARTAVSMMRFDLSQAFHVLYDDLGEENKNAITQNQKVAHTLFDGRKQELIFTSLSHRNYYQNRRESEQTEVSYFLSRDRKQKDGVLVKRESALIDEDLYDGGQVYEIIDGVSDLEFTYWDEKSGRWEDKWNSDAGGQRDRFPYAVKMKLTVQAPKGPLTIETSFKLAFTNNENYLVQF